MTDEKEDFETIEDVAIDVANYVDAILVKRVTFKEVEFSPDDDIRNEFLKKLHNYIQDEFENFLEDYYPSFFIELIENNNDELMEEGKLNKLSPNMIKVDRNFIESNKNEIICLAVLELEGIIRNYKDTYKIVGI